jgi:hypothetical protein
MSERSEIRAPQVWVEHVHINDEGQPVIGVQRQLRESGDCPLVAHPQGGECRREVKSERRKFGSSMFTSMMKDSRSSACSPHRLKDRIKLGHLRRIKLGHLRRSTNSLPLCATACAAGYRTYLFAEHKITMQQNSKNTGRVLQ